MLNTNPRLAAQNYASWNGGRMAKVTPTPKKLIFIKPLHRYWKRALLTTSSDGEEGESAHSVLLGPNRIYGMR